MIRRGPGGTRAGRVRHRVVAAGVAVLAMAGGHGVAGLEAAAAVTPVTPEAASLTVSDVSPVELRPGGTVTITGSIATGQAAADVSLLISRTVARTGTRSEIDGWLSPQSQDVSRRLDLIATVALGTVAAGESRPFTAVVRAGEVGLRSTIAAAGPYGLLLDLVTTRPAPDSPAGTPPGAGQAASLVQARGFLIWSPDVAIAPLQVGMIAVLPTVDPDPSTGLIDPDVLEQQTGEGGSLARALATVAVLPATMSVDPLLLASAAADGAGPSTRDWLRGVPAARGDREVVVDSWGRPDPDLLAASGRDPLLRDLLAEVRALPGAAGVATLDTARLLGGPVRTDVEVATSGLRAEGMASIAGAGHALVVPQSVLPLVDADMPFTPDLRENLLTTGGTLAALLTDADLEASATLALAGDRLALTTLLAQVSATALQRPSDQRVVGLLLAEPAAADPGAATALGTAMTSSAFAVPVGIEAWLATPPAGLTRMLPPPRDAAVGPTATEVAAVVDALLARRRLVGDLSGSLVGPRRTTPPLDLVTGSAVATSLEAVGQVDANFAAQAATWQQGVRLIPGSSILLAASVAEIRRTITNETTDDIRLQVDVVSRSPRLRIASDVGEVTIPAGEQVVVVIPVEAVSNGRAQLIIQLATPAGAEWGPPTELEVRVATGAETGALAVAAVLITLVFVLGTVRTIRRSRRRTQPVRIES